LQLIFGFAATSRKERAGRAGGQKEREQGREQSKGVSRAAEVRANQSEKLIENFSLKEEKQ
jgi:hypothetical protein